MSRNMKAGIAVTAVAAALVVSSFTRSTAQPAPAVGDNLTRVLEGNYQVNYDYALADQATKSERVEHVKRIEFHSEYVVIVDHGEAGRMIPVHSLRQLRWDPS